MSEAAAENKLLDSILKRLVEKHGCHTIILYGSRATEEFESTSDFDICGFRTTGDAYCDCIEIDDVILDAWIYPDSVAMKPDESMLRLRNARVLLEHENLGTECIEKVLALYDRGPAPLPEWERQKRIVWLRKTLARTEKDDLEGRYRKLWLLHLSLEYYFELRGKWYCGSKESFKWLRENDPEFLTLFKNAIDNPFDHAMVSNAVNAVIPREDL